MVTNLHQLGLCLPNRHGINSCDASDLFGYPFTNYRISRNLQKNIKVSVKVKINKQVIGSTTEPHDIDHHTHKSLSHNTLQHP